MASPTRRRTSCLNRIIGRTPWLVPPLLLILVGCGVPGETDVTLDGPAQQRGTVAGGSVVAVPGPARSTDPEDLIQRYLRAGAGGPQRAADHLRSFFMPELRMSWQSGAELTVVRVLSQPVKTSLGGDSFKVTVDVQPVGALTERGTVVEPSAPARRTLEFSVLAYEQQDIPQGADELRVDGAPDGMFLDSRALDSVLDIYQDIYQLYPIYFWDAAGTTLIPDLRYLPLTAGEDERRQMLVQWAVERPSDWLGTVVRPRTAEIALRSKVVYSVDRLVVDLTFQAAAVDLDPLAKQLAWTLRPVYDRLIELRVEGQPKKQIRVASAGGNPALLYEPSPMRFCVVNTQVLPECTLGQHLPVLDALHNVRVAAAAVAKNHRYAALVRVEPNRPPRLLVGQMTWGVPSYVVTNLTGAVMSRPCWLPPPSASTAARGLIAVDGALHMFTSGSKSTSVVRTAPPGVTGVSVAPDGLRVVIAADGAAYVATLTRKGETLELQRLRRLSASLTEISAVAWSRPGWVVLVGRDGGRYALTELTVDGAIEDRVDVQLGEADVTQLSAYPAGDWSARGPILIESQGKAWQVFTVRHVEISVGQASGASVDPGTPAPVPSAPFLQD